MATDPRVEVITELREQTELLRKIVGLLVAAKTPGTTISSVDLDGQYGDPVVRAKDPKDWTGEPMKGRKFSECPAEYLEMLAERFDYFASKEEDAKKQKYNLLDAQRARSWAGRLRSGWTAPTRVVDETQTEPTW